MSNKDDLAMNELLGEKNTDKKRIIKNSTAKDRINKVSNQKSSSFKSASKKDSKTRKYIIDPINTEIKDDYRNIKNNINDIKEKGLKNIGKDYINDKTQGIRDGYQNFKNDINDIREKGLKNASKDYLNGKINSVKEIGKDYINDKVDDIKDKADKIKKGATAAKKGAEFVAKNGVKAGIKAGATAAASAATAGAAAVAAAAKEVALKAAKKAKQKVNQVVKNATGMKSDHLFGLSIAGLLLSPLVIIIAIIVLISAGDISLASEDTYTSVLKIIKEREKQFDMPLIKMPGDGKGVLADNWKIPFVENGDYISHILLTDYDDTEDKNKVKEDNGMYSEYVTDISKLSVKTFLKERVNSEYDDYIPTKNSNDVDDKLIYRQKLDYIRRYLLASRENFDLINWYIQDDNNKNNIIKDSDLKYTSNILYLFPNENSLRIPDWNKYSNKTVLNGQEQKEETSKEKCENMVDMYIASVFPYLQHWVEPFAINISSSDNRLAIDVLERMKHPIDLTLFGLDRAVVTEKKYYYLKINVTEYDIIQGENIVPDLKPGMGGEQVLPMKVSLSKPPKRGRPKRIFETTTEFINLYNDDKLRYDIEYVKENDEYVKVGEPYSVESLGKSYIKNFKYVPKVTYAEGLYQIVDNKFEIKDYDFSKEYGDSGDVLPVNKNGVEIIYKYYDQQLIAKKSDIKTYKVSYMKPEDYDDDGKNKKNGNRITRLDWMFDYGVGKNEMYPNKFPAENTEEAKRVLDWFNKMYSHDVYYKSENPNVNNKEGESAKEFNTITQLKAYLKLKYQSNPRLLSEKKIDVSDKMIPCVQPYAYDDIYLAYDRIDEYINAELKNMNSDLNNGLIGLGIVNSRILGWPAETPVIDYIYGITNAYYNGSKHNNGIHISARESLDSSPADNVVKDGDLSIGPNVLAAQDGTIVEIKDSINKDFNPNDKGNSPSKNKGPSLGNYIKILNNVGNIQTIYGHLSLIAINEDTGENFKVGDEVKKGTIIGSMGKTGDSNNVDLYFEVKENGSRIDPLEFYNVNPKYGEINRKDIKDIPSGYVFKSIKYGIAAESIIEAASMIQKIAVNNDASYSLTSLPNSIEACYTSKTYCCATLVTWSLYEAGFEDIANEIIDAGVMHSCGMDDILKKYAVPITSYQDLIAGDIVFWAPASSPPHVQIYAGDGGWYNFGNSYDISNPNAPRYYDASGDFGIAYRILGGVDKKDENKKNN